MYVFQSRCQRSNCGVERLSAPAYIDALIAPDGTFYRVDRCGHSHGATHFGTYTEMLEAKGWVHFSLAYMYNPIVNHETLRLTQAQRDVLFDILMMIDRKEYDPKDLEYAGSPDNHHSALAKVIQAD